jgi:hypothetical protein
LSVSAGEPEYLGQGKPFDETISEHGYLPHYKVVDGKPLVLIPWNPTWEPPDEYPEGATILDTLHYFSWISPPERTHPGGCLDAVLERVWCWNSGEGDEPGDSLKDVEVNESEGKRPNRPANMQRGW